MAIEVVGPETLAAPSPIAPELSGRVVRAHGGGGEMMGRLISEHIVAALGNRTLNELTDGAVLVLLEAAAAIEAMYQKR